MLSVSNASTPGFRQGVCRILLSKLISQQVLPQPSSGYCSRIRNGLIRASHTSLQCFPFRMRQPLVFAMGSAAQNLEPRDFDTGISPWDFDTGISPWGLQPEKLEPRDFERGSAASGSGFGKIRGTFVFENWSRYVISSCATVAKYGSFICATIKSEA